LQPCGEGLPHIPGGVHDIFRGAYIFIALKEHPFINLIFQIGEEPLQTFYIGPFQFTVFHDVDGIDVCRYQVILGYLTTIITFIGVDCTVSCGTQSNVDFVNFILLNNDMLGFRRYALTFLPTSLHDHGRLLCLRHYRVASMGWSFSSRCVPCADNFRERLRPLTGCLAPAEASSCTICRRQPLILRDMALQVLFTMSYNIERFEFTCDVTHQQYGHALSSGRSTVTGFLPPDFPYVTIKF
jgi:hypothetical protein